MSDDSTYTVRRATTVQAPAGKVFEQIEDFRRWTAWSPWEDLDPDLRRTYSGADSGQGAVYEWSGNRKAGSGRMEITETRRPSVVVVDLRFIKPFKAHNTTTFSLEPQGDDATTVTWTMTGQRTLATKMMGIFSSMDKMIGPDFEKGLARLKGVVEAPTA
jgi:uncharacterized protein YndB with AHSA1/START domain